MTEFNVAPFWIRIPMHAHLPLHNTVEKPVDESGYMYVVPISLEINIVPTKFRLKFHNAQSLALSLGLICPSH